MCLCADVLFQPDHSRPSLWNGEDQVQAAAQVPGRGLLATAVGGMLCYAVPCFVYAA